MSLLLWPIFTIKILPGFVSDALGDVHEFSKIRQLKCSMWVEAGSLMVISMCLSGWVGGAHVAQHCLHPSLLDPGDLGQSRTWSICILYPCNEEEIMLSEGKDQSGHRWMGRGCCIRHGRGHKNCRSWAFGCLVVGVLLGSAFLICAFNRLLPSPWLPVFSWNVVNIMHSRSICSGKELPFCFISGKRNRAHYLSKAVFFYSLARRGENNLTWPPEGHLSGNSLDTCMHKLERRERKPNFGREVYTNEVCI